MLEKKKTKKSKGEKDRKCKMKKKNIKNAETIQYMLYNTICVKKIGTKAVYEIEANIYIHIYSPIQQDSNKATLTNVYLMAFLGIILRFDEYGESK